MALSYQEVMSSLKKRIFKPVYFLAGEEPYYIDLISDYIADNVLTPEERSFNQLILYGEDSTINNIIEISRRFPMMASHQVVIVKEAQSLKKIEDLSIYLEKPMPSTILVFCHKYKSLDKRLKLSKILDKMGCYFDSPKLRDNQIPAWIERFLMNEGIRIDPTASATLTEFLGNDLSKIANELKKLIITLPKDKPMITTALIEKNIGISKDYNNFELQKAIGSRNILKANRIVTYFANNQKSNPLILTIISLFSYFSKILIYHYTTDKSRNNVAAALKVNPFFVSDYELAASKYGVAKTIEVISLLRTYDLKSKGFGNVGADPGELLRELVFKIMH